MAPSLIFLFYRSVLWKYPFFRKKNTLITLSVITLIFAYYVFMRVVLPKILPFSPGNNNLMTMFSIAHYKEYFNAQLLSSGFMVLIWASLLLFYAFNRKLKLTAMHWFLGIASCSAAGLLFVFDAWRGSGDWDIFSVGAVITNLSVAFILMDLYRQKAVKNIKYGVCIISVFAIMHTSFWVATNATDKSIGWVEKAFITDPASYYRRSFTNESMLGAIFSSNNLTEKSLYWEKMAYVRHQNDPRTGFNYAGILIRAGKIDEAVRIYESSISKFPTYALPYAQLVSIYMDNKNYDALYNLLLKMERVYQKNPEAFTSRLSKEQIDSFFNILNQMRSQTEN
jgi:tetratricopeptide (TPR) repeat protein